MATPPAKMVKRKLTSSPVDKNLETEATEGLPCVCGKDETHFMLLCTVCSTWVHYECAGFPSVAVLSKCLNDTPGNYVRMACKPDLGNAAAENLKALSQDGSLYFHGIADASNENKFDEAFFQRIVKEASDSATQAATKAVLDFMKEENEKREKKNNLVVVGFSDQEKDEPAQNAFDLQEMKKICQELSIPDDSIVSTFREGRIKGKRIMKVCFADRRVSERRMFLSGAGGLIRDHDICKGNKFRAFDRPDLTAAERERDFHLRKELSARRDNGEKNLVIRNGKIVERGHGGIPNVGN